MLDQINLGDLINKKIDDPAHGKCCSKISYRKFSICVGPNCPKLPKNSEIASNFCIEVLDDKFLWRLCNDDEKFAESFHTQLKLNILTKSIGKKPNAEMMKKLFLKSDDETIQDWHWDKQVSWKGKCKDRSLLQSPIDISISKNETKKAEQSGFEYEFSESHTLVKKYFNEVNVHFVESAGVLKFSNLVYQPQYLSFKFPAEHTFNSKRYAGEVQIFFNEMNPNVKSWITNGLIISFPLNPGQNFPNLDFLEKLNMDYWKFSLKNKESYQPKTLENKKLKFSLQEMMKYILNKNPNFYSYVGGLTVPPCTDNIIHIVLDKPLELANCQFRVLRENSLLTDRPKEIHARLLQRIKMRKIIQLSPGKFKPEIKNIIPRIAKKYYHYNKFITDPKLKIKKSIPSQKIKILNQEMSKLKMKTLEALKVSGPNAEKIRKEALNILKGKKTEDKNCENI
jgi:carbonic anhydrase